MNDIVAFQMIIPVAYSLQPVASFTAYSLQSTAWIFLILSSYFIGSFPTGYLVGRYCGIDIRQHGSGNVGATNVLRALGKKWGAFVFAIDVLKGWLPVFAATHWSDAMQITPPSAPAAVAGIMALIGHSFPLWLRFKGGKGVATSVGIIIGMFPGAFPFCLAGWFLVFFTTGYVSLASMVASAMLPLMMVIFFILGSNNECPAWMQGDKLSLTISFVIAALVIWRHRGNIKRLCEGTESSFKKK